MAYYPALYALNDNELATVTGIPATEPGTAAYLRRVHQTILSAWENGADLDHTNAAERIARTLAPKDRSDETVVAEFAALPAAWNRSTKPITVLRRALGEASPTRAAPPKDSAAINVVTQFVNQRSAWNVPCKSVTVLRRTLHELCIQIATALIIWAKQQTHPDTQTSLENVREVVELLDRCDSGLLNDASRTQLLQVLAETGLLPFLHPRFVEQARKLGLGTTC